MSKANVGFKKFRDLELLEKAKTILTGLVNNNTLYPTPSPALTVLSGKIDAYEVALHALNAASGGKTLTALKEEARKELEPVLFQLGLYVQKTSNGVESSILAAGFDVHKAKTPPSPLPTPENLRVKAINKGRLNVKANPVQGAKAYAWEYKLKSNTEWKNKSSTAAKVDLEDLESGKEYEIRVAAVGANAARNYTSIVSSFVL